MFFNENGLSIRDQGGNLKVRAELKNTNNGWWWNNDINDRNLWTFNTAVSGKLMSEWNKTSKNTLGFNGSKWTTAAGLTSYLFRQNTVYSFGWIDAEP